MYQIIKEGEMEQKTLNISNPEMVLVRKSDIDFVINYINEALVQAEEFISDKANGNNRKKCDVLLRKLYQCDAYACALMLLGIISVEQLADYEKKNAKCRNTLLKW